jgi:hypothetical protein
MSQRQPAGQRYNRLATELAVMPTFGVQADPHASQTRNSIATPRQKAEMSGDGTLTMALEMASLKIVWLSWELQVVM